MKNRVMAAGLLLAMLASTAVAKENFVQAFLKRYQPAPVSNVSGRNVQLFDPSIQPLIRDGILPLTVGDMIRLMLDSNLDVRVNRFAPLTSEYLVTAAFRPFEPTLTLGASMNRNTAPSPTQLEGATVSSTLIHNYSVGYSQTLMTGTSFGIDLRVTRNSTNSSFATFNPSYRSTLTYSFAQPLLQGFGRNINTRGIRVARNNQEISALQFESQLINLVTQAHEMYWDLVLTQADIEVRQRSLELAQKNACG